MNKAPLAPLPQFVKDSITSAKNTGGTSKESKSKFDTNILDGVDEGSRNNAATSVAGKLLKHLPKNEWEDVAWPMLQGWNLKNRPKEMSEEELRTVFESVKKAEINTSEENNDKSQSVALQLVEEIKKEQIVFFHTPHFDGYAALKGDGREILKLRSRAFKQYIAHFFYKHSGKIISSDILINIIQVLEGKALYDGECFDLGTRIVKQEDAIWYDLGEGSVIHIDKDGWSISNTPPILFKRHNHQLSQVIPQHGGTVKELCNFINLTNPQEQLLFQVYTVAAFIPGFPHPLLVFYGPQGSGKTTPSRLLKSLIDPSVLKTLSSPDSEREFVQLASHHYFIFLDNLSSLPGWLSDSLARASTGDGFSKRELFTDDEDVIYSFERVVTLNGINLVIQKADLLDRSILLGLERIPKEKRREEQEFWKEFDKQKPLMLGAIFSAVSGAIREYPNIRLSEYPRMADFTRWGCAIAKTLGYTQEEFLEAYYQSIERQNEEAIEASPVGTAIIAFIEEQYGNAWEGTASDLLTELEKMAEKLKVNIKSRDWPKDPVWLSRRIQLIHANLMEQGIEVIRDDKARPRRLTIQKARENSVDTDMATEPALNGDSSNTDGKNELNNDLTTASTLPTVFPKELDITPKQGTIEEENSL